MDLEEFFKNREFIVNNFNNANKFLKEKFQNDLEKLSNEFSENYVKQYAKFKIGDFIKYYVTIKVEKIEAKVFFGEPKIYYLGYKHVLNKSGKIVKSENSRIYTFGEYANLIEL